LKLIHRGRLDRYESAEPQKTDRRRGEKSRAAQFQPELPLQSLFQSPTIAEMAAVIAEHRAKKLNQEYFIRILSELESLSDKQVRRLLSQQTGMANIKD
jgi:hypothetical protein